MESTISNLRFDNTQLAFAARTDAQLKKAYWLFKMIGSPALNQIGPPLLSTALKLNLPLVEPLVRNTIFELFCGGTSLKDSVNTSNYLYQFGVQTILDYSVEGEKTEAGFDATCEEIIRTLLHGGKNEPVAFSACKLTGLADFDLMDKRQSGAELSKKEVQQFERVKARLHRICRTAQEQKTPIFIDAEETWIQDTIDELAEEMMATYNQEACWVYTTIQHYRWDRLDYLKGLIERSKSLGYLLGVKLVRGAYLEKETERAREMGYENPMQPSKEATDADYDAALELCTEHIDHVCICAGTHNEASSLKLTQLMAAKGLQPGDHRIIFSQLLGMSDNISFNLGHAGYRVAKYLPYGPVKAVMPYLIRRANENTSVAGQSSRELELIKTELGRRGV
ncbi:MAG: proline dehydrogenase family protein [Bacteroidota bacterium]